MLEGEESVLSIGDGTLEFSLAPATLDAGLAEEQAAFGRLSVVANGRALTEGVGLGSNELEPGPHVSAYHLSEWFVRNWWRLAYEPPSASGHPDRTPMDWEFAHWMSTIGEGYVWPNIRIASDGLRVTITSFASMDPYTTAFRYVGAAKSESVGVDCLRHAVRTLTERVLELLDHGRAGHTELHDLWSRLQHESTDRDTADKRRIEALLGFDPDDANPADIRVRLADAEILGRDAIAELAADAAARGCDAIGAADIAHVVEATGFAGNVADVVEIESDGSIPAWGTCEAWRIGVTTAHAVRRQAGLDGKPLGNDSLASIAGTSVDAITQHDRATENISFAMDMKDGISATRIAMRSKWETGRRFDLARLTAERLFANGISDPLRPATQSYTYRQKAQRAFAAELLAPVDAIEDFLGHDRSDERCNDAAEHFMVSPVLIHSLPGGPSTDGR